MIDDVADCARSYSSSNRGSLTVLKFEKTWLRSELKSHLDCNAFDEFILVAGMAGVKFKFLSCATD